MQSSLRIFLFGQRLCPFPGLNSPTLDSEGAKVIDLYLSVYTLLKNEFLFSLTFYLSIFFAN